MHATLFSIGRGLQAQTITFALSGEGVGAVRVVAVAVVCASRIVVGNVMVLRLRSFLVAGAVVPMFHAQVFVFCFCFVFRLVSGSK